MTSDQVRIENIPALRTALITGLKVFHYSEAAGVWFRILNITDLGQIRELALTPVSGDQEWMMTRRLDWKMSWDDSHKAGKIRTVYANLFKKGERLTVMLPPDIMALLEHHNCLHLVDDSLFS